MAPPVAAVHERFGLGIPKPRKPLAAPKVSFDTYAARYLQGLRRGDAASPAPLAIEDEWLARPVEAIAPASGLEWLFDDAFRCGRALSRERLLAGIRKLAADERT